MHNYEAGGSSGGPYRGGHTLLIDEARQFHRYSLLVPPDFRLPKNWVISWGGLAVPPLPMSEVAFRHAVFERRDRMQQRRNTTIPRTPSTTTAPGGRGSRGSATRR